MILDFDFDKRGVKGNDFAGLIFILTISIFLIFVTNYVTAGTWLTSVNVTNISGGWGNASYNYNTSTGSTATAKNYLLVNEDNVYRYNLTVSHVSGTLSAGQNLTGVNITLPSTFAFYVGSNATGNTTSTVSTANVFFNATPSAAGDFNGSILSWNATAVPAPGWIINSTGGGNATQIVFNASAYTPGMYNITAWFIYNFSTAYNLTNITVVVNDTTIPFNVNVSGVNGPGFNRSFTNASLSITINVTTYDNGNFSLGNDQFPEVLGVNVTIYNNTAGINASYNTSNVTKLDSLGSIWNVTINTSNFPDGVYNISIYTKDQKGNVNVTNISNVRFDNTKPTASVSCTPATVNTGDSVTCSCSVSDATSGVNSSATSITENPSTSSTGTFTQSCSFADMAGNTNTAISNSYTIEQGGSSSGGGGGGGGGGGTGSVEAQAARFYTKTVPVVAQEFKDVETITQQLGAKERVKVKIDEVIHYVGVREITATSATVEVASDPVQVELKVGEDTKVDVNDDSFYDVHVKLNAITNGKADLVIKYLHESYAPTPEEATTGEEGGPGEGEKANLTWLWILIVVVVIVIIAYFAWKMKK